MKHETGTIQAADGTSLYWRRDVPDRPATAVMLLHGLGEHSGRYQHVIDALNGAGHGVYALDHRGHGRSEGKRLLVRSYDEMMGDIDGWYREIVAADQGDVPLVVLGHSMGGNLALGYTLRHRDRVAGLALSGALLAPGDDVNAITTAVVGIVARFAPGLGMQAIDSSAISSDPAVVAAYLDDPLVFTGKVPAGIAAALLGELRTFPDRYRELDMPVLVMHGTEDRLTDPAGSRQLAAGATNASVTTHFYDGMYHEIFNEPNNDAVLADLVAWLDGIA